MNGDPAEDTLGTIEESGAQSSQDNTNVGSSSGARAVVDGSQGARVRAPAPSRVSFASQMATSWEAHVPTDPDSVNAPSNEQRSGGPAAGLLGDSNLSSRKVRDVPRPSSLEIARRAVGAAKHRETEIAEKEHQVETLLGLSGLTPDELAYLRLKLYALRSSPQGGAAAIAHANNLSPGGGPSGIDWLRTLPAKGDLVPEQDSSIHVIFDKKEMFDTFEAGLASLDTCFCAWQYVMDHTDLCKILLSKLRNGITGKIIFDKKNFFDSSCYRQIARVLELLEAGCEVRYIKPRGAGFACMHTKTWILDHRNVIAGSCNMSHNGIEFNWEQMTYFGSLPHVKKFSKRFDEDWEKCTPVSDADLEKLKEIQAEKVREEETANQDNKRRRSRSLSVARSLTKELDAAESPDKSMRDRAKKPEPSASDLAKWAKEPYLHGQGKRSVRDRAKALERSGDSRPATYTSAEGTNAQTCVAEI